MKHVEIYMSTSYNNQSRYQKMQLKIKLSVSIYLHYNRCCLGASVDTEMCCPKGKCGHRNVLSKKQVWMSIFHIINFIKKKQFMDTGVLDFFNKKLILDYYFCLKSGPVFLFQIFIIAPLPLPKGYKIVSLIIN